MMKHLMFVFALVMFGAAQETAAPQFRVKQLAWLAGCWSGDMKSGKFEECWTVPRGDSIQVSARIVNAEGKTTFREFISVDDVTEGVVMTVQHFGPKLQPQSKPVEFKLVKLTETEAIFENPMHDHPQRIAYLKQPDSSVISRISKLDGSRAVNFPMFRPGATRKPQ
jgi:hypothetical protein